MLSTVATTTPRPTPTPRSSISVRVLTSAMARRIQPPKRVLSRSMGWVRRVIGGVTAWFTRIVDWVMSLKPVRVIVHFNDHRGPLLAAGLSNQAIFAVFAAIWVAASTFGLVLQSNPELRDS